MPGLTIGDTIPNLEAESTHGKIKLYYQFGDSWAIIFSHPGDFTPVCTTELGKMAEYSWKFPEKGVKLVVYHATICLRILSGLRTSKPTSYNVKHKVATSANLKSGDPMIISPLLSQDEAKKMFPQGYKTMDLTSKKEYLRFTDV